MSAIQHNYYDTLGVAPDASRDEIKQRYRELARRHHPDVASSSAEANRFREINEANRILSDPSSRANYDAELKLKARAQPPVSKTQPSGAKMQPSGAKAQQPPTHKNGTATSPRSEQSTAAKNGTQRTSTQAKRAAEIQSLLGEAEKALACLRYREADE